MFKMREMETAVNSGFCREIQFLNSHQQGINNIYLRYKIITLSSNRA